MRRCVRIKVTGKIQGVNYRSFIQKKASLLGVEGTIQNETNGGVLIFACGPSDKLDDLIDAVYTGSEKSKVEDVVVEPMIQEKDFRGVFRVIGKTENE